MEDRQVMEPQLRERIGIAPDRLMLLTSSSNVSLEDSQVNVLEYEMRDAQGRKSHRVKVSDKVLLSPVSRVVMVEIFDIQTGELRVEVLTDW